MKLQIADLEHLLDAVSQIRVGIIGDICLDRNMIGDMAGISRDAPVPIVNIESDEHLPGGAGTTTLNVRGLGAQVFPLGVIGNDISADIIISEFLYRDISDEFLIREEGRHTQTYSKLFASSYRGKPQQIARFDRKNYKPISPESEQKLLNNLQKLVKNIDALIVDDYAEVAGTGTITDNIYSEITRISQANTVLMVGDSRERILKMKHFTVLVPNEVEVAMAFFPYDYLLKPFGQDDFIEKYTHKLLDSTHCSHVICTRGPKGALVASKSSAPITIPVQKITDEIDVTGAGDTFAAALATSMAFGFDIIKAVEFAHIAASITLKKLYTTGVATPQEISEQFQKITA